MEVLIGDPDPLSTQVWGAPRIGPLFVRSMASHLTSGGLSPPRTDGRAQLVALEPPFCMAGGRAQMGLSPPPHSPSKGQEAGSSLLSDETSTQGSLSLMKGSLCGVGRPLAKDKTSVCPPSLARGWGLPLGWLAGWGWAQVRSLLPFSIFPSPSQSCSACLGPLLVLPSTQGVLALLPPSEWGAPGLGQPSGW